MKHTKRAGWLMIVSGALVAGLSMAYFFYALLNRDGVLEQVKKSLSAGAADAPEIFAPETMFNLVLILCVLGVIEGMLCAMLGALVLRKNRAASVTSMVITGLRGVIVVLLLACVGLVMLLPGFKWDGQMTFSVVMSGASLVYLVWQMVELILAWREMRPAAA